MTARTPNALVIGAGLSGLAAAGALKAAGIPVTILDGSARIADVWRNRHPRLRLNTHRALSGLPGMTMPATDGAFPRRGTVVRFLEDYARFIDVPVKHGVTVERVSRNAGGWSLKTSGGKCQADHVVVATGHNRRPVVPEWPGLETFAGRVVHSADFGEIGQYVEKSVLVVGAGNSGVDVLNHLADVPTGRVWVSVRHGPTIFPTRFAGVPTQRLSPLMEVLPTSTVDTMLAITQRLAFGNLQRYGLTGHASGAATRLLTEGIAPGIDNGFVAGLKSGRFAIVPEISGFEGRTVRFADGTTAEPDVVIAATGYRTGLEDILTGLDVLGPRGVPHAGDGETDPQNPGLWFIGMHPPLSGMFRAASRASAKIAEAIVRESSAASGRDLRSQGETALAGT